MIVNKQTQTKIIYYFIICLTRVDNMAQTIVSRYTRMPMTMKYYIHLYIELSDALLTFSAICCYNLHKHIIEYHFGNSSLLLYEAYANESSQICPFLALRPEFHSNLRVILSTPRYCQSAIFGWLTFCVYTLLFYGTRV